MRVLLWCGARGIPLRSPTGGGEHLRGVGRALVRAGHAVRAATPLRRDDRGEVPCDLPSVHVASTWPRGLRSAGARIDAHRRWSAAVDGFAPELVWERFDPTSAAPARRAGCPRLVEVNAPVAWERRWPDRPRPREERRQQRILEGADRVIAVSRWLVAHLARQGVAALHVPNGVEPLPPGDRDRTRAELGLHGPVAVYLGSMHRWQGAEVLPALVDALGPGWTVVAAGHGERPPADHPRLRRLGRIAPERVPDLLAAADVGLAPYDPAGPPWFCPLKVLACRAAGLPVVATDVGDVRELVGEAGRVVPDRDPERLAAAVAEAAALPRTPWVRTWDDVVREALAGV